jgi:hypothetical protein
MDGEVFSPAQIEKFKTSPKYYLEFVKAVEQQINSRFPTASLSLLKTALLRRLTMDKVAER